MKKESCGTVLAMYLPLMEIEPMQILITEEPKTRMKTEYADFEDYDEIEDDE